MVQSNPALAGLLNSPEGIKSMFSKENIQMMRQLDQIGLLQQMSANRSNSSMNANGGMGGFGGMGSFGGMGGFGRPVENLSPNDIRIRYPNAIQQIEEMGFSIDDNVLQVLHRFNGNVEQTINFLMQSPVCC